MPPIQHESKKDQAWRSMTASVWSCSLNYGVELPFFLLCTEVASGPDSRQIRLLKMICLQGKP